MINEDMLKKAAAEADQAIRDSLPTPAGCDHEFSPAFQRKMLSIFRRARHPVLCAIPRYIAGVVLATVLIGSTWLTVNAEARDSFFSWVREQYTSFVTYRFIGEAPTGNTEGTYMLTWLPEGFSFQSARYLNGGKHLIYADDSGRRIVFSYLQGDDTASLFVASDYQNKQSVRVGTHSADFYQASEEASAHALVWLSDEENTCFCILADLPKDVIIKIAEHVQKK